MGLKKKNYIYLTKINQHEKVIVNGVAFWQVDMGRIVHLAFDPKVLIVELAVAGLGLCAMYIQPRKTKPML